MATSLLLHQTVPMIHSGDVGTNVPGDPAPAGQGCRYATRGGPFAPARHRRPALHRVLGSDARRAAWRAHTVRADAMPHRDPRELSTVEAQRLIDDLAAYDAPRPILVLTGGDPFERDDLADLVRVRDTAWTPRVAVTVGHATAHGIALGRAPFGGRVRRVTLTRRRPTRDPRRAAGNRGDVSRHPPRSGTGARRRLPPADQHHGARRKCRRAARPARLARRSGRVAVERVRARPDRSRRCDAPARRRRHRRRAPLVARNRRHAAGQDDRSAALPAGGGATRAAEAARAYPSTKHFRPANSADVWWSGQLHSSVGALRNTAVARRSTSTPDTASRSSITRVVFTRADSFRSTSATSASSRSRPSTAPHRCSSVSATSSRTRSMRVLRIPPRLRWVALACVRRERRPLRRRSSVRSRSRSPVSFSP